MRILGGGGLLILMCAAFTPLPNWLNAWMAGSPRLEPADAIVVLGRGGADSDHVLTNRSLGEEAGARAALARGLGVPAEAIEQIGSARTTREEAGQIRGRLLPRGQRRILLVGDPIDMPRARAVMEHAGFTVLPAPTAATGPSLPAGRLRLMRDIATELVGLAYYHVAGFF